MKKEILWALMATVTAIPVSVLAHDSGRFAGVVCEDFEPGDLADLVMNDHALEQLPSRPTVPGAGGGSQGGGRPGIMRRARAVR